MENAADMRRLVDEMAGAYEERIQSINAIKQETADFLNASSTAHQEMAAELRAKLAQSKHDLEMAESERKAADQAEIRDREIYIENMLVDFDKAHQEMSDQLRAELAKVRPELMSSESERNATDQAQIRERKWAVSSMLEEFGKEQAETAAAWRGLLARMESLRGQAPITGMVEGKAAVKTKMAEEDIGDETEDEKEDLEEEVLELLGDNPDGLKMVAVADMLGLESWRSLIPIMRDLLDEGEITKENSTYYIADKPN